MSFTKEPKRLFTTIYDPVAKIWSGIKTTPTYGPNNSIGKAVLEVLLNDPEHIFQICFHNGKKYTNKEIANLAIRVAQHFQKLGTQQSEMIGIVAGNIDYLAPLVFGALLCGLIICPLDPIHDKEIIISFYAKTRPTIIFTVGSVYQTVKQCLTELDLNASVFTLNDHMRGVPEISEFLSETGTEKDFKPEPLYNGYNQIAAVLRSSGTTGIPKAICITHAGVLNTTRQQLNRDEVCLRNSNIYWISGFLGLISRCLQNVTSVINEDAFKSSSIPDIMEKYKVTSLHCSQLFLIDILKLPNIDKIDFSSLRKFSTGGCAVPYSLIEKAKTYMSKTEFSIAYGLTESCGALTAGPCNAENHVGQLVPNIDIKIIDDQNRNLEVGEVGEICFRNIFPWPGYYKDPELTAAVYRDGWIHSGDLGYINEEGNLFILERKKEVVYYMKQCIYPNQLEMIISEIPGVEDVCVCGLPNDKVGQLPAAAILKSDDGNLTAEEIYEYVAQRVEDYKKLRGGVYFANFIPKTLTGKNLRFRTTNICEAQRRVRLYGIK